MIVIPGDTSSKGKAVCCWRWCLSVCIITGGEEALDLLRDTSFDVAVVDLNLGGCVDGLRVLEAIRWRWPGTAAVILTAHGSLESAMAAIREDVDAYLLKPSKPAEVRQAVQEALERRKKRGQAQGADGRVIRRGGVLRGIRRRSGT